MSSISDRNLPLFLISAGLFAASTTYLVSQDTTDPKTPKQAQSLSINDNPPVDAKDAEMRVEVEDEEEKFAYEEEGYSQPLGASRPALIVVMVSCSWICSSGCAWCERLAEISYLRYTPGPCVLVSTPVSTSTDYARTNIMTYQTRSGKSTIGMSLAEAFDVPFIDGDSLHPKSNVDKMSAGHPLDDNDRLPWLALIRATAERVCREQWITKQHGMFGVIGDDGNLNRDVEDVAGMADWEFGEGWRWKHSKKDGPDGEFGIPKLGLRRPAVIIACSALKKWYRDILRGNVPVAVPEKQISGTETNEVSGPRSKPVSYKLTSIAWQKTMVPKPSRMDTYFVYCKGSRELLSDRIAKRKAHFMRAQVSSSCSISRTVSSAEY
jgi:gluconate kinase